MSLNWIAKAQKSWRDVTPGHAREHRKGRGRVDKTPEQLKVMEELQNKIRDLLSRGPCTFHHIQCAIRPPAYETDLRAALKAIGAVRDNRLYSLPEKQ